MEKEFRFKCRHLTLENMTNEDPVNQKAPIFILDIKPSLTIDHVIPFLKTLTLNTEKAFTYLYTALPYHHLKIAKMEFSDTGTILFGSPYLNNPDPQSFTGPIATRILQEVGAQFVFVATKEERRSSLAKNFAQKILALGKAELSPIYFIGEDSDERENGQSLQVLKEQLGMLSDLEFEGGLMIVYQIPFESFSSYLPKENEIEQAYQLCQAAIEEFDEKTKKKVSWFLELPIDFINSDTIINQSPFNGFYFVKSGIFPGSVARK
ncbi:hypothetical protein PHSC3_001062 [Chlamydiales bacterium STE3]|nr:hypothetical protein PHSC3_001062 [Chlamydiales bacterium STE3]